MAGLWGADLAALRELSKNFDNSATQLDQVIATLDGLLATVLWHGPDREEFNGNWATMYRASLAACAESLVVAGDSLRSNADAQERTSAADTGAGGVGGAVPATSWTGGAPPATGKDRDGDPDSTDLGELDPVKNTSLTDKAIGVDTIAQGQVGDCSMLSTLGAIAERDPSFFREHMKQNEDGTWTVTMYKDGKPVDIIVNPDVPYGGAHGPAGSNWVSIYEKAAAEYFGGSYEDLTMWPHEAYEAITGQDAQKHGEGSLSDMEKALERGPVMASTEQESESFWNPWDSKVDDDRIVANHAYTVLAVEEHDGQKMIHLANPWGPAGSGDKVGDIWLTEEEYKQNFAHYFSTTWED